MKIDVRLIALSMLLTSCSPGADTNAAEQEVTAFHQAMDTGQYAEIYEKSDSEMKSSTSRDRFVKLLGIFHQKLGAFQSGKQSAGTTMRRPTVIS